MMTVVIYPSARGLRPRFRSPFLHLMYVLLPTLLFFESGAVLFRLDGSQKKLLPDPLLIPLNGNAIDAINAAQGGYFSIGGTLNPVPEPRSALLLASALMTALAVRWRNLRPRP
jgi:hypothetical protein